MGRKGTDRIVGTGSESQQSSFPYSVLRSRWLLVVAVTALVALGGPRQPTIPQMALVGAMILSNLVLGFLRNRGIELTQALEVLTVADVLVVTVVVGWVDPTPPTYLAVFSALILAMALGRVSVIMMLMLLVCGVYAGYLYTEVGANFWRQVDLVLRIPFLFAIGVHFASIASYLKEEKSQRGELLATAKKHADRATHMAKEQDRLRALSTIGRLALTSTEAPPVKVLLEMTHRAQRALGAQRCSLIVFPQNDRQEAWNGRTKDRNTEVRTLTTDEDPLGRILPDGKLGVLYPGDDKELLRRIKVFFPDSNPFGAQLVAPIHANHGVVGAMFLIDADHKRKFSDGEVDFFWTVSLMTGAFIDAREKLENEVQMRTLITNAPVIMFATNHEGEVTLFEGRGRAVLSEDEKRTGKPLFDLVDNPTETRECFEQALAGKLAAGTMSLSGTHFETQYSPLRGVDGEVSGVMGVTTAILDDPGRKPEPLEEDEDLKPLPPLEVAPPAPMNEAPNPTPEPALAPAPEPAPRPAFESAPERAPEPIVEPTPAPTPEPAFEPTPESAPEPAPLQSRPELAPDEAPLPLLPTSPPATPDPTPAAPPAPVSDEDAPLPLITPVAPPAAPTGSPPPAQRTARQLAEAEDAKGSPADDRRTAFPNARPDLKPSIPLADEEPED